MNVIVDWSTIAVFQDYVVSDGNNDANVRIVVVAVRYKCNDEGKS